MACIAFGGLVGWAASTCAHPRSQPLIPQFENSDVKVWKTILAPHENFGIHRHEHGKVVMALKDGE